MVRIMSEELLVSNEGGVLTLTINRPERRNALSWDVITGLRSAVIAVFDGPPVSWPCLRPMAWPNSWMCVIQA